MSRIFKIFICNLNVETQSRAHYIVRFTVTKEQNGKSTKNSRIADGFHWG